MVNREVIDSEELQDALLFFVRDVQNDTFASEIQMLKNNIPIIKSNLASLNPFIDENGLLRVGGRLGNTSYATDKKQSHFA